jgi:hypothetical protein
MTDTATQTAPAESGKAPDDTPVTITVQNLSSVFTDQEADSMTKALAKQAAEHWNDSEWVTQKLAPPVAGVEFLAKGETVPEGTWHLELLDTSDQEGALGYHEDEAFEKGTPNGKPKKASTHSSRGRRADAPEVPLAKVFCQTTKEDGEQSSEVASHEMLEMLADPYVMQSLRTITDAASERIYPVEICDPVQSTPNYEVDGIVMSNFAEPAYFGLQSQSSDPTRYDYCGVLGGPVPAMTPGGYLSYAPVSEPENWQQEFGSPSASAAV